MTSMFFVMLISVRLEPDFLMVLRKLPVFLSMASGGIFDKCDLICINCEYYFFLAAWYNNVI